MQACPATAGQAADRPTLQSGGKQLMTAFHRNALQLKDSSARKRSTKLVLNHVSEFSLPNPFPYNLRQLRKKVLDETGAEPCL